VYLPQVSEKNEELVVPEKTQPVLTAGAPTIMVVEDDAAVRELATKFLSAAGYRVLAAKDGVEALQIAEDSAQAIGALLTDVVMPKMRGTELAVRLGKLRPEMAVVFMSGYLENNDDGRELIDPDAFLEKPFTRETLVNKVNQAFRSPDPPRSKKSSELVHAQTRLSPLLH
jgi:two-component system cell cycle sensor histidine kinase/response regulator CckA